MDPEPAAVKIAETAPVERHPMHLRYLGLLRTNRNFRRLWAAQLISEIGDWFYSLAVYDLLLQLTGSSKAVSWAIIIQTLPWFLMTPLAGPIVDRLPRRRLMIAADLVRGFVVLGLLLVRARSQVALIYALLGAEVLFASIFEPARNALLPDVVSSDEILPANALASATWSTALAVGAGVGGAVTALAGREVAFVVNSLSFFASAALVAGIRAQESHLRTLSEHHWKDWAKTGLASLRQGARYLRRDLKVLVLATAKTGLGFLGGSLLLLAVFGERLFAAPGRGAMAVGCLYAARGVGAGTGPLIGDFLTRGDSGRMWKSISLGYFLVGLSYVAFSRAPTLALAVLPIVLAHMGASNVWVMSTTLLQLNAAKDFRGRVFALDFGLIMLAVSVSNYLLGVSLDAWRIDPRQLALLFGCALLIPGFLWLPAQARWAGDS
jgi:predicted MFS family arabinose efflux permease